MTSLNQELLWDRAGHQELPDDIGPDPDPDEPYPEPPQQEERAIPRQPVFHLTDEDFTRAADMLTVEVAVIRAVTEVEAAGRGFLADGRPVILFESHVFGRLTDHRFGNARDTRGRHLSTRSWDRTLYGPSGAWQHDGRLGPAAKLDWDAAHKAASWGYFQVLGTNHASVGHPTIRGFVEAMHAGAGEHLDLMVRFIRNNRLDGALRRRDWASFARGYNGPAFRQNRYDEKLEAAYRKWRASPSGSTRPILRQGTRGDAVAELQRLLTAAPGHNALRDDGVFGPLTEEAVRRFQRETGIADDGIVGPITWAALDMAQQPEDQ